ncbi:MAG: hypothetical protein IPO81_22960 [Kouleothrix sp.]|nr:hypothetical protein [Kouleothrix sp.]
MSPNEWRQVSQVLDYILAQPTIERAETTSVKSTPPDKEKRKPPPPKPQVEQLQLL